MERSGGVLDGGIAGWWENGGAVAGGIAGWEDCSEMMGAGLAMLVSYGPPSTRLQGHPKGYYRLQYAPFLP